MHLFTTVFRVLASWAGARIMDKYPTTVCSGSSDWIVLTDWIVFFYFITFIWHTNKINLEKTINTGNTVKISTKPMS